ncbi:hypothetical protein DGMP_06700 [Desulfomarina profundi]|uniref:Uncharacterized protein n=1 Tax=Desulfomarina profundi TaxID=2772557 RepID=A0A8D5JKX8_9BACT|nr:hypothetical protein [Desulfomarina profundi]BCL59977.1 hypothetical protein DGMP_06700 [Desulfomarina profundi]
MAYVPQQGDKLRHDLTSYTPIQGNGLLFRLADAGRVCEYFVPQNGREILLDLEVSPDAPLDFVFARNCYPQETGETPDEPPTEEGVPLLRPGVSMPWGNGPGKERNYVSRWRDAGHVSSHNRLRWQNDRKHQDNDHGFPWGKLATPGGHWRVLFSRLARCPEVDINGLFGFPPEQKKKTALPWDELKLLEDKNRIPFRYPPRREHQSELPWQESGKYLDPEKQVPYRIGLANDHHHTTRWGKKFYKEICLRDYRLEKAAGTALLFDLDTPIDQVDDGALIRFHFDSLSYDLRCSHREPSGFRDAYIYVPSPFVPVTPTRGLHIIMNNVLLTRVSDDKPLDATSISLTTNFGSWCWGFEATLKTLESYLAARPDTSGNKTVRATVNGYDFLFEIDGASEQERFGEKSWSVRGRSISAELARPGAVAVSYTEGSDRNAVQLAERELENTGWTIDWQTVDWLVSAGAFSYTDKVKMEAIIRIAEAVGAQVQTIRDEKKLVVLPRYNGSPWNWDTATPDLIITESVVRQISHEWAPGPGYNGIFVTGTAQGVMAKVKRTGSAGDRLAPMVTDALITQTAAARERGRVALAASGSWQNLSIVLPLFAPPGQPGLLLPGALVKVVRPRGTWVGQVTGNRITGMRNNGLSVRQVINVERWRG